MREIIIQRLIKSRERILAGGYYGNKKKLSTDWLHILFIIYGWRNQGRKSTKDDTNSWMNTKSTLLTTSIQLQIWETQRKNLPWLGTKSQSSNFYRFPANAMGRKRPIYLSLLLQQKSKRGIRRFRMTHRMIKFSMHLCLKISFKWDKMLMHRGFLLFQFEPLKKCISLKPFYGWSHMYISLHTCNYAWFKYSIQCRWQISFIARTVILTLSMSKLRQWYPHVLHARPWNQTREWARSIIRRFSSGNEMADVVSFIHISRRFKWFSRITPKVIHDEIASSAIRTVDRVRNTEKWQKNSLGT